MALSVSRWSEVDVFGVARTFSGRRQERMTVARRTGRQSASRGRRPPEVLYFADEAEQIEAAAAPSPSHWLFRHLPRTR